MILTFCAYLEPSITAASMNSIVKHTIPQGGRPQVRNLPSGRLGFVGPTMATNLLSTGLIAVKAWCALPRMSNPDDYL